MLRTHSHFVKVIAVRAGRFLLVALLLSIVVIRGGQWLGYPVDGPYVVQSAENQDYAHGWMPVDHGVWARGDQRRIHSDQLAPQVSGYGGAIAMHIVLDAEGDVESARVVRHAENKEHLKDVLDAGVLNAYEGLSIDAAIAADVDAVSGATTTSHALILTVQLSLDAYRQQQGGVASAAFSRDVVGWREIKTWLGIAVVMLAGVSSIWFRRKRRLRTVQLLLNVIVLGFVCGTMLSMARILGWAAHGGWWVTQSVELVMAGWIVVWVCMGRGQSYCTSVCPFGSLQELAGRATGRTVSLPRGLVRWLRLFRSVLLFMLLLLVFAGGAASLFGFEPFSAFQIAQAAPVTLWVAGLFAAASLVVRRPWCRYACPTGALLQLLGR
jgi:hypothetical protein